MKILFINYINGSSGPLIRTFELAKSIRLSGHTIYLYFLHKNISLHRSFLEYFNAHKSDRFIVQYIARKKEAGKKNGNYLSKHTQPKTWYKRIMKTLNVLIIMIASFRYIPREIRLFNRIKPDIIVVRPDLVFSFVVSCKLLRIPFIMDQDGPVEELGMYRNIFLSFIRPFITWRAHRANALLAISKEIIDDWKGKKIPEKRLYLCPNGADPELFNPQKEIISKRLQKPEVFKKKVILAFSGVDAPWHGTWQFISMIKDMVSRFPQLLFLFIGPSKIQSYPEYQQLPEQIKQHHFHFTDTVPYTDIPTYIGYADIAVMPYPYSSFFYFSPLKMYETMAMGKIIVAPGMGQIGDVLSDFCSVFLYDPKADNGLPCSIEKALLFHKSGGNGNELRNCLQQHHTWENRGKSILRICETVIKKIP